MPAATIKCAEESLAGFARAPHRVVKAGASAGSASSSNGRRLSQPAIESHRDGEPDRARAPDRLCAQSRSSAVSVGRDPDWGSLTLCRWILCLFQYLVAAMGGAANARVTALMDGAGGRRWARMLAPMRVFAAARRRPARTAALAMLVALAAALSTATFLGTGLSQNAAKRAESFLALMEQRSPGSRTGDQLTKTKGAAIGPEVAVTALPVAPQFGPGFQRPLLGPDRISLDSVPLANLPSTGLFSLPLLSAADLPPPIDGSSPPPGCCGGTTGGDLGPSPGPGAPDPAGPGGPPDAGSPPGSPGRPFQPPVTPVPEPDSWATMLLGFWLIGWSIRSRGTQRAPELAGN